MRDAPHHEETMNHRHWAAAVVLLAVFAAACSTTTDEADGEIGESFARVLVEVGSGDVQVERTTGPAEWLAEAKYSGDRPDFSPRVVEGDLVVDDGCAGRDGCSVRYRISVPEGTEVVARSSSGDISVTSISAPVDVESASGTVFLNTVKGAIVVTTASGDIIGTKLESAAASFSSSSGSIDVAFEVAIADLTVETDSGNLTAQLAGDDYDFDIEAGGSIDLKIDDDDASTNKVVLRAASGDITVYKQ
jgi:hypothetical protein